MTVSALSNTETPMNTDIQLSPANKLYLRHLIERGYGWEDIVVKCRSIPLLRGIAPEAIRSLVLRFPLKARRPGGASGALCRLGGRDDPTQD